MKKNKFLKDKYLIIRNFVPKNISKFLFSYFVNKRTTAQHLFSTKYISPFEKIFGTFGDSQIKNKKTFCMYGDIAMDTLLYNSFLPIVLEEYIHKEMNYINIKIDHLVKYLEQ